MKRDYQELMGLGREEGRYVCVGLDLNKATIAEKMNIGLPVAEPEDIYAFGKNILEETHSTALEFKPNYPFYASMGAPGIELLQRLISLSKEIDPYRPITVDAKVADIGNTNEQYAEFLFDQLGADAITVHLHHGHEAMAPFLKRSRKGIAVVVRTSNPGAQVNQDRLALVSEKEAKLWDVPRNVSSIRNFEIWTHQVVNDWNVNGNCSIVLGATNAEQLGAAARIASPFSVPLLIPGAGYQGGSVPEFMAELEKADHRLFSINSSRSIIFNPDPGKAVRSLATEISQGLWF